MDPNQQQLLLTTGGKKSTYVEDVYKSYPYRGTGGATQTITTGLDISGDGGLVWVKNRTNVGNHTLQDSLIGDDKYIVTSSANGSGENDTRIKTITSTGFQVGSDGDTGGSAVKYASFNFKKSEGFFDLVEYTGNSSASQTIAHGLGCVPGCFMLKSLSTNGDWRVWHRSIQPNTTQYGITLNGTGATYGTIDEFGSTDPTATQFTVGGNKNTDGVTYRCYLFAGNNTTLAQAATARSVDFDGSDDNVVPSQVMLPSGKDSNQFCLETWFKIDNSTGPDVIYGQYLNPQPGRMMFHYDGGQIHIWMGGSTITSTGTYTVFPGQWYHVAWTYDGTNHRLFLDGILKSKIASSSFPADIEQSNPMIGNSTAGWILNGQLSNFRITLDQAVYTTSFTPSTQPLTTTSQGVTGTNCKILCFNNTSVTHNDGSGITLTASGGPTASTQNPFDDPECFQFGEEGDQNIIKCGSYIGNGTGGDNGVVVNLGWQPQYLLMKNTASVGTDGTWLLIDDMRGIASDNADAVILANNANAEVEWQRVSLTARGFKLTDSNPQVNGSNNEILYIAIRGTDPLVAKPAEAGTEVFAMDVGSGSANIPPGVFDSGFPVDFALMREPVANSVWYTTTRLQRFGYVRTNDTNPEAQGNPSFAKDSNVGWGQDSYGTNWMTWMWKKCQGFDTVAYTGNGVAGREISHSLGRTPEMIWIKARTQSSDRDWQVGHIGINGGTNPWNGFLRLNTSAAASGADNQAWNSTAPTSRVFTIGDSYAINHDGYEHIAMLFASVDGISKCGYYTGSGSARTITTGFQPRFLFVKNESNSNTWNVVDTMRGWAAGNDERLWLNDTSAQDGGTDMGQPTSTGFTLADGDAKWNISGNSYIYYAHA